MDLGQEWDEMIAKWEPGQIVEVNNHNSGYQKWVVSSLCYDYDKKPHRCPACEEEIAGTPWMGWMWCGFCDATCLVKSRIVLIPVGQKR